MTEDILEGAACLIRLAKVAERERILNWIEKEMEDLEEVGAVNDGWYSAFETFRDFVGEKNES